MQLEKQNFQGSVDTWLFMMDREFRSGENRELNKTFRELRKKIESDEGVVLLAMDAGGSKIVDIDGMMFWVNVRKKASGTVNVFVSSRRSNL